MVFCVCVVGKGCSCECICCLLPSWKLASNKAPATKAVCVLGVKRTAAKNGRGWEGLWGIDKSRIPIRVMVPSPEFLSHSLLPD